MTDAPSQKMTDQTIARLRGYGKGNGIKSEDIVLVETKEQVYALRGALTLTPHCDVKGKSSLGRIKGKGYRILSSFDELKTEVDTIKKDFEGAGEWTADAIKELENTTGHGWGLHGALLKWSDQKTLLSATENCPQCRGTALHPCTECQGIGSLPCHDCQSRGQEQCPQCAGHGHDPYNPNNKCPTCNGTGWALCRFCQGQMKKPCHICQGRGTSPCTACQGSGFLSQEVQISKGARMDFRLGSTSGLPSGLLRGVTRIGEDKLHKGHADITMKPRLDEETKEPPKGVPLVIDLEAKIPYADIKLKIGATACVISSFGKQGKLSGLPAFLDEALAGARLHLDKAAKGREPLEMALSARAIKDAFGLVLSGKTHPNDLRRLYPVGLSGETAQEIMQNLGLYFRNSTARTRMIASFVYLVICAGGFAALCYSPLLPALTVTLGKPLTGLVKMLVLMTALAGYWQTLRMAARSKISKQFNQAQISMAQTFGRTGYATLGVIVTLYFILLFLTGNLL